MRRDVMERGVVRKEDLEIGHRTVMSTAGANGNQNNTPTPLFPHPQHDRINQAECGQPTRVSLPLQPSTPSSSSARVEPCEHLLQPGRSFDWLELYIAPVSLWSICCFTSRRHCFLTLLPALDTKKDSLSAKPWSFHPPASTVWVLGLQTCAITPPFIQCLGPNPVLLVC